MTKSKHRIVHVSGDFPDSIEPFKTPVIRSLLELTSDQFDHHVYSLNRRSPCVTDLFRSIRCNPAAPRLKIEDRQFENGCALVYHAPPRGFYHATMLKQLGAWLAQEIARGPRPRLLVGHKLTIEGIAVAEAAQQLGLPYAISIQGDTDTKVLDVRPDLLPRIARIYHQASVVFPFSPWALEAVERKLGKRKGGIILLPCPTDLDEPQMPRVGGDGLITVFHLKNHRRKNLRGMVAALGILASKGSAPKLRVIGGGNPSEVAACRTVAAACEHIEFSGAMERNLVQQALLNARGFVMPSLRESFGLVFIEALFSGLPIAYPSGTAVDGYLDGLPFAIRMDARDPQSIADAMRKLDRDEAQLKDALGQWLESADAKRFTRQKIASDFARGLSCTIAPWD